MRIFKAGDRVTLEGVVRFWMDCAVWEFEDPTRVWEISDIDYKKKQITLISGGYGILHSHPRYGGKPEYTYGSGSIFMLGDDWLTPLRKSDKPLSVSDKYAVELENKKLTLAARYHSGEHFFSEGQVC